MLQAPPSSVSTVETLVGPCSDCVKISTGMCLIGIDVNAVGVRFPPHRNRREVACTHDVLTNLVDAMIYEKENNVSVDYQTRVNPATVRAKALTKMYAT